MVRPLDVSIYHSILCCIFCLFVVYCLLKYIETYLERASLQNDRATTYKDHLKMSEIVDLYYTMVTCLQW